MVTALSALRTRPARHQPDWAGHEQLRDITDRLAELPPLVEAADVRRLRAQLAAVAAGQAHVVQIGDCAEDPEECSAGYIARKAGLLDVLAGIVGMATRRPVVRVGRMAGQFAKPRSRPTEHIGGLELPVYRGHLVNSPEPDPELRRPDPRRLLTCYRAAAEAMTHLGRPDPARRSPLSPPVWTSHEALLLDYELPLVRPTGDDTDPLLTSTHWPWIGERTRQPDGAHVALLASVANPVACKIGPGTTPDEALELCARLDPRREPGRLTLIARMGADLVAARLPPLVRAVRAAGHPVVWLTDPMHGNTVTAPGGLKTRFVEHVVREVQRFQHAVRTEGGVAGGLHLETTPDDVTECVHDASGTDRVGDTYTSFCDPRLNPGQAIAVAFAWRG
ncbi:3-deoxy-7-phosphoheptulonate synthase [Streptomyces yaizuensis]|uniref:Phospho-2-dehydro-3-deoxyheptonate aldolase n=1 Tax=Streptomyces yaizuensis TaxID=2989713 RepID=A0ABQ5NQJ9_9ACTN|nr:3-deoxy-7-phosphoheptulonate synthase [Streptomyces sp. YSPA8]GLF92642.1 3-deoxy-7-phosphoheptulonate synthase [Streptomyces sp. YSPA8]